MNWIEYFRKYQTVLILSGILVTLVIIKAAYKYDPGQDAVIQENLPTTSPLPSPTVTMAATPTIKIVDKDYPLWELLPYKGKGFVVDRYVEPLTLAVKISGIDQKIIEDEVYEWLEENGMEPGSHKIRWE
ncbi:MAG: hypothetical protein WC686_05460 [Candidatus Shapirobacteria bacterium]|jgi:hypothetical protein